MSLGQSKKRYQAWGEFLKRERARKFRSAREFCTQLAVGISYPQYSRYEAGEQLPALEHAIELCKLLEIPVMEGLLEWNRAQLTHLEDDGVLTELNSLLTSLRSPSNDGARSPGTPAGASLASSISLDDLIVFNRSHLRLFSSDPRYRDIFTYINSYAPEWISVEELTHAMKLDEERVANMLQNLNHHGVVTIKDGKCTVSKRNFYFPDDAEFFELRNQNLIHNSNAILEGLTHDSLSKRQAYRGLITRELTARQLDQVVSRVDNLLTDVVNLPETDHPEKIYSICLLLGERFNREDSRQGMRAALPSPGLTKSKTGETAHESAR